MYKRQTYNNTACACSLSATQGGLAIRLGDQNTGAVIDAVGWGTTTNIFFEGTKTTAPGSGNSQGRKDNGCQDTDDNLNAVSYTHLLPRLVSVRT